MGSTARLILTQAIDLIEPLTRFDRSSLQLRDESSEAIPCTGVWTAEVTYSSSVSNGNGKLPSDVRNADSQSGMERGIASLLDEERAKAANRMEAFAVAQAALVPSAQRPLAASDCFSGPIRVGYDWSCSKCTGKGKVTCTICIGSKQIKCPHCGGQGWTKCAQCQGSGSVTCTRCNGQSGWNKQVEHTVFNSASNQYTKRYENVWEHCMSCQHGKVQCHSCSSGKNNCYVCSCSGRVQCTNCLGSGEENCAQCDGKGYLHRITTTTCDVANAFGVEVNGDDAEVRATTGVWDYATFASLADIASGPPATTRSKLVRTYVGRIALTRARLHCEGKDFVLYGYGAPGKIFDFKGMVTHLLTGDLDNLQTALAQPAGLLATRNQESLRRTLGAMLRSEVNQQLCDAGRREALIGNGTVTREHADTTVTSLRKAMGRLYRATATMALSALSLATLLTLYLLYGFLYMLPGNRLQGFLIFAGVVAACAVAAEWAARKRTLSGFAADADERKAAARLLQATGTLRRWRITAGVAVAASIFLFFWITLHHNLPILIRP